MAMITIVAHNNEHTINFDEPIPQPSRVRLISGSFYNSWNVLKSAAEIALTAKDKNTICCKPSSRSLQYRIYGKKAD